MRRRYATADVFTTEPFSGNPVAVVLDAEGLTTGQMQSLAREFDYIETTFVLPPADPANTAHVRIFTPDRELAFAGHPNIGTAYLLARAREEAGEPMPTDIVFEEEAGMVRIRLLMEHGQVTGAELLAPHPLVRAASTDPEAASACLGLAPSDVRIAAHPPCVASVGLPFLVMELASRSALGRASPNRAAFDAILPLDGAHAVYAYVHGGPGDPYDLHARMFTGRMVEDPATGSATAAVAALLSDLRREELRLLVRQGEDMGRPSTLLTRTVLSGGAPSVHLGGSCVAMFTGSFDLP